jgi:hypothetical protein
MAPNRIKKLITNVISLSTTQWAIFILRIPKPRSGPKKPQKGHGIGAG